MWLSRFESWPGSPVRARTRTSVTDLENPVNTQADVGEPPSTPAVDERGRPAATAGQAGTLVAVVLAAGQGTRMRSRLHKVLHLLGGKKLIQRVLDLLEDAGASRVVVVLGHRADDVRRALPESVATVIQEPQLGTGHAVQVAAEQIKASPAQRVLVHYGDEALLRPESL